MNTALADVLFRFGSKIPYPRFFASDHLVILLYHNIAKLEDPNSISAAAFEQQVIFLKSNFEIIHPNEVNKRGQTSEKLRVMLTFDDGFRNHMELVTPLLRKHQVPALFFVSSRHQLPGKYLWFNYLRGLSRYFPDRGFDFRGEFFDMTHAHRAKTMRRLNDLLVSLRPHPCAMYEAIDKELPPLEEFVPTVALDDFFVGMTMEQVRELAAIPLFVIGAHTVNHPLLTRCDPEKSFSEIRDSKLWIEKVTSRQCDSIAYPSGDYDRRILAQCQQLGFLYGYAVAPKINTAAHLEFPRIGVYAGDSLECLQFKVRWGNLSRTLGIHR